MLQAKVREEVQTIQQSIEAATEERYLEGLQAAKEALKLIYSPPAPSFQAAPEQKRQEQEQARKRREMEEDKNHGKKPEMPQMVPRADLEGIRAEGSGREVLLQARFLTHSPCSFAVFGTFSISSSAV